MFGSVFVNINGDRTGLSEDTVHLLDYFKTGKPTDDFTERLQQKVEEISEYSCAAEPPVQCSVSHLSRRSEPQ